MNPFVRPAGPGCGARSAVCLAAALAATLSCGCKDSNSITGPSTAIPTVATVAPTLPPTATPPRTTIPTPAPTARPSATPTPTPATISGSWTGSVAYHDLDYWWPNCTEAVVATVGQGPTVYGSVVSASIHTNCFDATFQGTLQDDGALVGEVTVRMSGLRGIASGTFSGNSLLLEVPAFLPGADGSQIGGFTLRMRR